MKWVDRGACADLHIFASDFLFGSGHKPLDTTRRSFSVAVPFNVYGLAIIERSEVRGVYVTGPGFERAVVEGSPVAQKISAGQRIELHSHDITDGMLALRFLRVDAAREYESLPLLVLDHARVRFGFTPAADGYDFCYVQAPRIRGVRHRAGVIASKTDDTAGTADLVLSGGYFGNAHNNLTPGALSASSWTVSSTLTEEVIDASLPYAGAPWTATSLVASDSDFLSVSVGTLAAGKNIIAIVGWVAPS